MSEKLELAKKVLLQKVVLQKVEAGEMIDIPAIFDLVDTFFLEAQKRQYIPMEACPKCGTEVKSIDMGGPYRVQCECTKGVGANEIEAFSNWMDSL